MDMANKKIGILGMARSGIAAAEKARELGAIPFLSEFKAELDIPDASSIKDRFKCEFGGHSSLLFESDLVVVSPGVPSSAPIIAKLNQAKIEVISEIEFGFRLKHPDTKIIAITGSNGKSTTVSLIHHLLKVAGYNSVLAGNIGDALTGFPIQKPGIDFLVLELSSFQLELIIDFRPDVAAILNITPDHLNRYSGFEEYAETKFNIFRNMKERDLAILNLDDAVSQKLKKLLPIKQQCFSMQQNSAIFFENSRIRFNDWIIDPEIASIKGPHNIANIMSAILATSPYISDLEVIRRGISTFSALPHRMEFVRTVAGVSFYNDSKATNTDSVRYALQSFPQKIRIILGGKGKGEDFGVLSSLLKEQAEMVYLTGSTIDEMKTAFSGKFDFVIEEDFDACLKLAYLQSNPGDIVVLSPACTSYDRFKNFEKRGEYFKNLVQELV